MEEKKICNKCKKELPLTINYYKCHNDEYYDTCKTCVKNSIIDNVFKTFKPYLKDMDYPFIESEWIQLVKRNNEKPIDKRNQTIFGKYISKMRLKGFKGFTWEDSIKFNEVSMEERVRMNPLAQRIGIYYVDLDWATYMIKTIVEDSGDTVERSAYSKNSMFIEFKDGSYIKFLPMNESVRGQRFTKAYIQDKCLDKNRDVVFQVIYPSLTLGQDPECYILNEYEDLWRPCTRAKDFYYTGI